MSHVWCLSQLKEFRIVGRHLPTEKDGSPQLYRMRVFAPDVVTAKSRFWYFLKRLKKVKKANGEVVLCQRVRLQLLPPRTPSPSPLHSALSFASICNYAAFIFHSFPLFTNS